MFSRTTVNGCQAIREGVSSGENWHVVAFESSSETGHVMRLCVEGEDAFLEQSPLSTVTESNTTTCVYSV